MPSSYMDDAPATETSQDSATGNRGVTPHEDDNQPSTEQTDDAQEESDECQASTGLVPKDFFMGADKKPGDTCRVKVVHVYDDQIQIEYLKDDGSSEESGEPTEATGSISPPSGMTGMDE